MAGCRARHLRSQAVGAGSFCHREPVFLWALGRPARLSGRFCPYPCTLRQKPIFVHGMRPSGDEDDWDIGRTPDFGAYAEIGLSGEIQQNQVGADLQGPRGGAMKLLAFFISFRFHAYMERAIICLKYIPFQVDWYNGRLTSPVKDSTILNKEMIEP